MLAILLFSCFNTYSSCTFGTDQHQALPKWDYIMFSNALLADFWNGSVCLFLGDSVIWGNDDDDDRNKLGYRHPWRTVSNGHHNFSSARSFNLSIALVYDQSPAILDPRHKKYFTWGHTCVLVQGIVSQLLVACPLNLNQR